MSDPTAQVGSPSRGHEREYGKTHRGMPSVARQAPPSCRDEEREERYGPNTIAMDPDVSRTTWFSFVLKSRLSRGLDPESNGKLNPHLDDPVPVQSR